MKQLQLFTSNIKSSFKDLNKTLMRDLEKNKKMIESLCNYQECMKITGSPDKNIIKRPFSPREKKDDKTSNKTASVSKCSNYRTLNATENKSDEMSLKTTFKSNISNENIFKKKENNFSGTLVERIANFYGKTKQYIKNELHEHHYQPLKKLRMRSDTESINWNTIESKENIKKEGLLQLKTAFKNVSTLYSSLLPSCEMSETLTEICKVHPEFDNYHFLLDCKKDFIPNILEASIQGNLEILKDWCYDAAFNALSKKILITKKLGYTFASNILDISDVELVAGKVLPIGPVLIINFETLQTFFICDQSKKVIEGDPKKILHVSYVWSFCRDMTVHTPKAAWKLLDLSALSREQFI